MDTQLMVVFGVDKEGGVVLQSPKDYLATLYVGLKDPIVGEPICREFRSPCPDSAQEEASAFSINDPVVESDTNWNIDLGSFSDRETSILIAISGGSGIQPRADDLGSAWTVAEPERSAEDVWNIEISPTDRTPVVGQPPELGGCWVEVECPKEPAGESKDD